MNDDTQPECGVQCFHEHWLRRAWRKILGAYAKHIEHPNPEHVRLAKGRLTSKDPYTTKEVVELSPIYAKDAIYVNVAVKISWADLIRCALGAVLYVKSTTYCQNPPGMVKTITDASAVLK